MASRLALQESYSFVLHIDGKRLAYAGNLERSALELLPHAKGVDILMLECAYLQADQLPSDLLELFPKKVLLTHIHPKYDADGRETPPVAASAALGSMSIVRKVRRSRCR